MHQSWGLKSYAYIRKFGFLGIAPTRDCTHFLKIEFMVTGSKFYSYYIQQGNELDKERKIVRKKLSFLHTKRFNTFFECGRNPVWVQFHVYRKFMCLPISSISVCFVYK